MQVMLFTGWLQRPRLGKRLQTGSRLLGRQKGGAEGAALPWQIPAPANLSSLHPHEPYKHAKARWHAMGGWLKQHMLLEYKL